MPVLFYIVVCYTQYKEKEVVYMDYKERFVSIYKEKIHRDGSEKLLEYLLSAQSDFFSAPASTRFHGSHAQGLVEHRDVYKRQVYIRMKMGIYTAIVSIKKTHQLLSEIIQLNL